MVSLYLNDIVLGDDTLEERKKIFAIRQQTKVADKTVALEISNTRIEEQKVLKAEQLKLQTEKDYQGRRLGLEALAGIDQENPDNRMSITQAAQFDVDTKKYGRGVDRISEIKIEGGATDLTSMAAGLAAIAGKTAEESGDTGKKATKSKDTED